HAGIAGGEKLERVRRISGLAVERGGAGLQVAPHPRSRAAPVRVDPGDAVEDLTGARVALRASDGPAALGPVDPLDARIARVEERRALGKVLDDERVLEAGLLEGVVPPERSPSDGRPLRLRDPAVQVIDDRLDRLGERRLRVLLDQPPPNG